MNDNKNDAAQPLLDVVEARDSDDDNVDEQLDGSSELAVQVEPTAETKDEVDSSTVSRTGDVDIEANEKRQTTKKKKKVTQVKRRKKRKRRNCRTLVAGSVSCK